MTANCVATLGLSYLDSEGMHHHEIESIIVG